MQLRDGGLQLQNVAVLVLNIRERGSRLRVPLEAGLWEVEEGVEGEVGQIEAGLAIRDRIVWLE